MYIVKYIMKWRIGYNTICQISLDSLYTFFLSVSIWGVFIPCVWTEMTFCQFSIFLMQRWETVWDDFISVSGAVLSWALLLLLLLWFLIDIYIMTVFQMAAQCESGRSVRWAHWGLTPESAAPISFTQLHNECQLIFYCSVWVLVCAFLQMFTDQEL